MTATYAELLKKSYVQRLRNVKVATGIDLLLQLDRISEDYAKEVTVNAYVEDDALATV